MFGGMTIFQWVSENENEYNLFYGKWRIEYGFEILTSKTLISAEWKLKNLFWGHIFPFSSGSIGPIVLEKKKVYTCVHLHQLCEFHKNRFETATCIVTVIIIISWKSRSVIF